MSELTIAGLTAVVSALVSTPPLLIWCMKDLSRRA